MRNNWIDDLIKSHITGHQEKFQPDDWSAMEKKLNQQAAAPVAWWKRYLVPAAASLLLVLSGGVAGYYYHQHTTEPVETQLTEKSAEQNKNTGSASGQATTATSADPSTPANAIAIDTKGFDAEGLRKSLDNIKAMDGGMDVDITKEIVRPEAGKYAIAQPKATDNALFPFDDIAFLQPLSPDLFFRPAKKKRNNVALYSENNAKKMQRKESRVALGVHTSPEMNMMNNVKVGNTSGIVVEVKLSDAFTISGGIDHTVMSYTHVKNDQPNDLLKKTDATFYLLGIPISAQYNIDTKGRIKPFVSAGLINYFPLKEKYTLQYEVPVDPQNIGTGGSMGETVEQSEIFIAESYNNSVVIRNYDLQSATPTNVLGESNQEYKLQPYFGIINLSAGVNYQLSPRLRLQMAPNLKIPLTGMGLEEMEINTIGLNTSFFYQLNI